MLADVFHKIAQEEQAGKQAFRFRPSSAGPERCIRALTYGAMGMPDDPHPGRALHVFDDGNWHAELMKDWIRKSAFRIHSEEMEVDTKVGKGHIDGVITDLLGTDILLEMKALNHFGFERIWKGQYPLDYLTQVALYIEALQKVNPKIDRGLLLIKNKNTAQYMELLCQYDNKLDSLIVYELTRSGEKAVYPKFIMEKILTSAVAKFDEVRAYVAKNALPPRPFPFNTDFPCGYCSWGRKCWEGYEKEMGALADDAELDKDIETLAAYYLEVSGHEKTAKAEKDDLKAKILDILKQKGVRGGKAGPYAIMVALRKRTRLDQDKIPAEVLKWATVEETYEFVTIRRPENKDKK